MKIVKVTKENLEYGRQSIELFFDKKTFNQDFLDLPNNVMYVALDETMVIGMVYGYEFDRPDGKEKQLFIYSIDVLKDYRKKHVATKLLEHILKPLETGYYRDAFVITNHTNDAAMNLYRKAGATQVTPRDDQDILFVWKNK
ncbi:GNAT family N-acetyltransferase [Peloplasma aerotolerans]|uniref:GNAT family N-acetyltransferase n=1 Tax=Peloplasma aerotolerans TaxID=3044389 RepID=A0AAW6U834_9MOLU|nr:GNAT family N-acetyltransferase [Mariniplasma sp. M4Ah]MDI6453100.1 GNAT family N-acetyltransferase [Mariniplasma sp. M4Ah]MDR4968527.1 GNAT family N-acetyltransferase [Acholeplasmataceae bacterium]